MNTNIQSTDLFCRMYINSHMPHRDFVSFLAKCVCGTAHMNSIQSAELDISVDDNDDYNPTQSAAGADRWLYFPYTLEIDPTSETNHEEYVAAIAKLLTSLWSAGIDAVAACDFEECLPHNAKRLNWH